MQVKFYKGPKHGALMEVNIPFLSPIRMNSESRRLGNFSNRRNVYMDNGLANPAHLPSYIRTGTYAPVMMTLKSPGGNDFYAPAMHPDGSIFYVWKGYDK